MPSNNLLKSGNVLKQDEARVIDSNVKVAERLQYLSEILQAESEDGFYDDFTAGLDAVQVEQLLGDPDGLIDGSIEGSFEDSFEEGLIAEGQSFDTGAFEQMKADAQAEADSILSAAREEAESIIAAANVDAEAIRSNAQAEGHEEGYKAGYDEGVGIAKEAEEQFNIRQNELETLYEQKIDELEPMFVEKITEIYEHIFAVDLSGKKELVLYLLTDAMRNIEGGKTFLVHVSREDYEYVSEHKEELTHGLPGTAILEVIEDMTLAESQCFIEADSGIFDCGLGTELSLLKKELTLLSFRADSK